MDYYYSGQDSRLEKISIRLWVVQVLSFVTLTLIALINGILVLIPDMGYPCIFAFTPDDIATYNRTPDSASKKPVVFLDSRSMIFFVYAMLVVWLLIAIYILVGIIRCRNTYCNRSYGNMELAYTIATTGALVAAMIAVWTGQVFVHMLSFRQITIAAALYLFSFFAKTVFLTLFLSAGKSPTQYEMFNRQLKTNCAEMHLIVSPFKAVVINVYMALYGMCILVLVLLVETVIATNFNMSPLGSSILAVASFIVLGAIYLVVVEVLAARYVHIMVGPHIGLLVSCIVAVAAIVYQSGRVKRAALASFLKEKDAYNDRALVGTLAGFMLLIIGMLILRIYRACAYHRYRQTKFLQKASDVSRRIGQTLELGAASIRPRSKDKPRNKRVGGRGYENLPSNESDDEL